jgi:hypothetical protein
MQEPPPQQPVNVSIIPQPEVPPGLRSAGCAQELSACQAHLFDFMLQGQVLSGKFSPPHPTIVRKTDV